MNLKKVSIINVLGIFLLSFLSHFAYDLFPNTLTSIFFPVNESIFEHTKMIFTTMMIYGIIEYFILKKEQRKNFLSALLISALITIIVLVLIFTPYFYLSGKSENMIITLIIYFISIVVGQIFSYFILNSKKEYNVLNIVSLISIPIIFTIYGILTYYPVKSGLWYDYSNNKYGLYTYYTNKT